MYVREWKDRNSNQSVVIIVASGIIQQEISGGNSEHIGLHGP